MYFDRFDICSAYYMFAVLCGHDAYTNKIQARLAAIPYRCAPSEEFVEGMTENARAILNALLVRHRYEVRT